MSNIGLSDRNASRGFRHELKYILSAPVREQLASRLGGLLQHDPNAGPEGAYRIRSLYFDDWWDSSYEEKRMGVAARYKYRIRIYNDSDRAIHLERKVKEGGYIHKEAARLTREVTERVLRGDYAPLLRDDQPLCQRFYHDCTTGLFRPKVMVDYEREPFVMEAGDVRITFDSNLRAGRWTLDLFDRALPMLDVMAPGELIMEVKYTEFLPGFLRSALPYGSGAAVSASKYVMARDKIALL